MVYLIVGLMLRIMIWVVKGLSFINKIGTFLSVLQYTIHVFRVIEKWLCINGVGVECHLFETITILRTALWFSHRMCSVRTIVVKYHYYNPKQIDQSITIQWMTWWCNTVSWTYCFKNTLRHVTTKFAHMNGHWKAYDSCIIIKKSAFTPSYLKIILILRFFMIVIQIWSKIHK